MSALGALLLVGARGVAPLLIIDSCVDVDAEEVRRLAKIELSASTSASYGALDVVVSCKDGAQELRLTDRATQRVTVRSIDLSASGARDRDARARELALAVAELFRRSSQESPGERAPEQAPAAEQPKAPVVSRFERTPVSRPPSEQILPWRVQLGVSGVTDWWTGGEALFGVDLAGRIQLDRWFIVELRLGGRKTRPVALEDGTIDAEGVTASAGISFNATPSARRSGLALGARFGLERLRYSVVDGDDVRLGVASASTAFGNVALSGFVTIAGPLGLLVDTSIGGALHPIFIHEDGRSISGLSGVLLSSAVGVAAQF